MAPMPTIRRPLSAQSRAIVEKLPPKDNVKTPSKVSNLRSRTPGQQQRMHMSVTKEIGHASTSSVLEAFMYKADQGVPLRKLQTDDRPEVSGNERPLEQDTFSHGSAHHGNGQAASETAVSEASKGFASDGQPKQPAINTPTTNGHHIQPTVRQDINSLDSEVQVAKSQKPSKDRRVSPLAYDQNEHYTTINDINEQEGHSDRLDGDHASPSSRVNLTFEHHLKDMRSDKSLKKTPLKTYSQNRTFAASQEVPIAKVLPTVEVEDDQEDALKDYQDDDEELNEIEIEILQIGEKMAHNDTTASRSPKRSRGAVQPSTGHGEHDHSFESDEWEEVQEPVPKKRRKSDRQIPNVVARKAVMEQLKGRRESRSLQKTVDVETAASGTKRKARTPKSSQKKKTPRRLPVDELVTSSQRLDDSEDEDVVKPLELPEDPILIASDEELDWFEPHGRNTKTKISLKIRQGQGFGPINIQEFRIPQSQGVHLTNKQSKHSDGFVGKEAEPIGRPMPVRQPNRRKMPTQRIELRMAELTLVAERFSDDEDEEQERKKRRRKTKKWTPIIQGTADGDGNGDDPMLIDSLELQPIQHHETAHEQLYREDSEPEIDAPYFSHEEQFQQHHDGQLEHGEGTDGDAAEGNSGVESMTIDIRETEGLVSHDEEGSQSEEREAYQEQPPEVRTPHRLQPNPIMHRRETPEALKTTKLGLKTPTNLKSCLKRQESTRRRVSFQDPSQQQASQISQHTTSFQKPSLGPRLSQLFDVKPTPKKPRKLSEKEEIEMTQQLLMVSIQRRRAPSPDSDDQSDEEASSSEDEEEHTPDSSSQDLDGNEPEEVAIVQEGIQEGVVEEPTTEEGVIEGHKDNEIMDDAEGDSPELMEVDDEEINESQRHQMRPGGLGTENDMKTDDPTPKDTSIQAKDPIAPFLPEPKVLQAIIRPKKLEQLAPPMYNPPAPNIHRKLVQVAREAFEPGTQRSSQQHKNEFGFRTQNPEDSWRLSQQLSSQVHSESQCLAMDSQEVEQLKAAFDNVTILRDPRIVQNKVKGISRNTKNPEDSYKPTPPVSSGVRMEVDDDDIDTSPTPIPSKQRASSQLHSQSQRQVQQRRQSKPLPLVRSRPSPEPETQYAVTDKQAFTDDQGGNDVDARDLVNIHRQRFCQPSVEDGDTQGSTILGGSQPPVRRGNSFGAHNNDESQGSTILGESQPAVRRHNALDTHTARTDGPASRHRNLEPSTLSSGRTSQDDELEPEIPESQQSFVPEAKSYFARASQQLENPMPKSRLSRTKSTPSNLYKFFGPRNEDPEMMAGGISMQEAFEFSPSQNSSPKQSPYKTPRMPTLKEERSSERKSLKDLTRRASLGLGTMPGSARKRMSSLPFAPPLIETAAERKASTA